MIRVDADVRVTLGEGLGADRALAEILYCRSSADATQHVVAPVYDNVLKHTMQNIVYGGRSTYIPCCAITCYREHVVAFVYCT